MGCARSLCASEKVFIFINIAFAMYSGALLATAARLAWDPSTYTWFRFLCATQYRASAAYVLAAGLWLAALVCLAAARRPRQRRRSTAKQHASTPLHLYAGGVVCLALSEVGFGAWLATSLARWWREAPQAELARRGMDLVHDLKPALLAVDRYREVARPLYDMIEEVEREAPNNVFVIIVFGALGAVLQVAAFILARRLARLEQEPAGSEGGVGAEDEKPCARASGGSHSDDSDAGAPPPSPPPGWRKQANLRMYTILDKIF